MKQHLHILCFVLLLALETTLLLPGASAQVQTGKSYANLTKGSNGGTFEPGDTLEIRSCIAVGGSMTITQVRYNDTINSNFTYIPGSLRIMTNEGLTFRGFTDAASDDAGMYDATTKTVRINLGTSAAVVANTSNLSVGGGTIVYNNRPSFYGGVCIMVASFRVKINSSLSYNTQIALPGGAYRYTTGSTANTVAFPANQMMLVKNLASCGNYMGSNVIIENAGTFGTGTTQNRSSSTIIPGYTFANFSSNMPNDGYYSIANNTSASGATNNGVAYPNSTRVFSVWDIIGDHTGATDPLVGNTAKAPGTTGGYMAVVNASYAINKAVNQTVSGICPNTYYDFSAWFRNICSKCACDTSGVGALTAGFKGSNQAGVKPNLTYQIDGVDYYTTGDLPYTGQWAKRGFTYLSGMSQVGFTLTIRNNSPGGGGNDWAMDDVNLATCEPNVNMNITPEFLGCPGSLVALNATVSSYYNNYTYYKWQKSTNGGSTWTDAGVTGTATPVLTGGQYKYTVNYPAFVAAKADSGSRYRLVAATTSTNLASSSCAFSNNNSTLIKIINCTGVLDVQLKNFAAQVTNKKTNLTWQYTGKNGSPLFEIEKSYDGREFSKAGSVNGTQSDELKTYQFADGQETDKPVFFRIKVIQQDGSYKYSKIIFIDYGKAVFNMVNLTNPFGDKVCMEYILPVAGKVQASLYNANGMLVTKRDFNGTKGINKNAINSLQELTPGIYTMMLVYENKIISKKLVKTH
ncbi:MAG: T9SS type A sorting domain-containing protein [Ferruginibacter sp.]